MGVGSADCSFSLSSFSLSRQRTPNSTWLTGCLFVTDVPEWLLRHFDQPRRHKWLLKGCNVISSLLQQTPMGSDLDQLEVNAQIFNQCSPLLGGNRLKTGISFCKKTRHTGSKILSIPIFLCTVITSADVFQYINSGCLPGERCGSSCNAFNQLRTKAFVLANVQIKYLPPPSTLKYFKKRRALI